jgi:hypothetical protein
MTQSALVLGSEGFGNEPLHKIRYGVQVGLFAESRRSVKIDTSRRKREIIQKIRRVYSSEWIFWSSSLVLCSV